MAIPRLLAGSIRLRGSVVWNRYWCNLSFSSPPNSSPSLSSPSISTPGDVVRYFSVLQIPVTHHMSTLSSDAAVKCRYKLAKSGRRFWAVKQLWDTFDINNEYLAHGPRVAVGCSAEFGMSFLLRQNQLFFPWTSGAASGRLTAAMLFNFRKSNLASNS